MADKERDRAVERLLKQSPGVPAASVSPDCLDAETLIAWTSTTLSASEAARIETHVADCDRCQRLAAAFVRSQPVPSTPQWWERWPQSVRWLVPVATAATVVAIWVAVPQFERAQPASRAPNAGVGTTALSSPAVADAEPKTAPQAFANPPDRPAAETTVAGRETARLAPAPPGAPPLTATTGAAAGAVAAQRQLEDDLARDGLIARRRNDAAEKREEAPSADAQARLAATAPPVGTPAPPPPPPPLPQALPAAGAAAPPPPAVAESVTPTAPPAQAAPATAAAPKQTVVAPETAADPERPGTRGALLQFRAAPPDIVPPNGANRWRIVPGNRVERSTDGGSRWERVAIDDATPLLAGHSPAPSVVWLVGRAGVIYVSTDGAQFTRVPFVESVDLLRVVARNDREATVTAADGRTFVTTDRGATWK